MTGTTTPQERAKSLMEKSGIPAKEIKVYGRQIVVTAFCRDSAQRWATFLGRFAKVRAVVESRDEAAHNKGTTLRPTLLPVWRTFAAIA